MICSYMSILSGCRYADESGSVEVKACSVDNQGAISLFTYGCDSNRIDYLVLELGRNEIKTQIEGKLTDQNNGNLKGVQYLKLDGMRVRLTSSHRLFIVGQQKCITMPLTLSLKSVEQSLKDKPQEFSEELQTGLNRSGVGEK